MNRIQLWGGRFQDSPSELLKRLNDSFSFDKELLVVDVEGSIAWAKALHAAGALTKQEETSLISALRELLSSAEHEGVSGDFEDVHSYVEANLAEKVGALAGKIHTGRSRNDQVACDLRLYLKQAFLEAREWTLELTEALVTRASQEAATPMPGYTHLQQAEPITFGHWCLAYVEMLLRDVDRFDKAAERGDECPLGSGALAGTPIAVDRQVLAVSLGFSRATANSLDAVSDRDLAADYLYAASMLLGHLSRLSEDLIIFSTSEFGLVELPDSLSTGSSRMPQKKNPDVLELVRGHAGRSIGELTGLLSILKSLPLGYNKDLQLDKEPLFRTRAVLAAVLPTLSALISDLHLNRARMRRSASGDFLLVTQLADSLARRGIPFREAHEIVGLRVAEALERGVSLTELGASEDITIEDLASLDVDAALDRKQSHGGTAPALVIAAAGVALKRIHNLRDSSRSVSAQTVAAHSGEGGE